MTTTAALLERLAPDPVAGVRAERGRDWLVAHGLPNHRAEAWRSSPLVDILAVLESARPAPTSSDAVDRALVDVLAGQHGGPRLVFINGVYDPTLSDLIVGATGLWIGDAEGLRARRRPSAAAPSDEPVDGFHALNWAAGRDVAAVLTGPDASPDTPVHVVHLAVPGGGITVAHPRTVVRVGRGSSLQVIETQVGLGGESVTNASTRIIVGEDASVTYYRVVAGSPNAIHLGRTAIEQAARSTARATSVITGGHIVRSAIDVRLGGPEARSDVDGLYLPTGHQQHDNVITVDHAASHCTSRQRFKGVVDDHGRGSFSGHVIVRPGTVGSDASQSNPNLVLASTAQADTRPWLEIFADDVRCTHGATVGRLDDDALFYLRSRGIPVAESRAMLVTAFADEIIDGISPPSLRDLVAVACARRESGARR
ncbi:MAG: Fe-S cluster assembly protein SufD [Microthrixaceae bacterium]